MKKYIITLISLIAFMFTACEEDYLDVNRNPTTPDPTTVSVGSLLPSAELAIAGNVGGYYQLLGSIWSQYYTQANSSNQYKEIDAFDIDDATFFETYYDELYSGALNDLKSIKALAKESEQWDFYLMATVLEAYTFQILADLYGEIPFTEALKGDEGNFTPKFDNGQVVYDSLIARINFALSKDLTNSGSVEADLIFNGNMAKWTAFANTLKLKMFLRQVNVRPEVAEEGIMNMYNNGVVFLTEDAAITQFKDEASRSNPLYESDRRQLNTPNNIRASYTMVSYLKENDDPRLDTLYEDPKEGDEITGMIQGTFEAATSEINPDEISKAELSPVDPVYFITGAESYFLQAEAATRYNVADAEELYNSGVTAAFSRFGYDATAFIAEGGVYNFPEGGTQDQKIETIIIQKWVSQARGNALEAYFDFLRTGYPEVSDVPAESTEYVPGQLTYPVNGVTNGRFPQRLLYPDVEVSRNPNTPEQKDIFTPVWWNK